MDIELGNRASDVLPINKRANKYKINGIEANNHTNKYNISLEQSVDKPLNLEDGSPHPQ